MDPFGAMDQDPDIVAQLLATSNVECGQDQTLGGIAWPNYYNFSDNDSNYSSHNAGVCMYSSTSDTNYCTTASFNPSYNSESQEGFYFISDHNFQALQNTVTDVDLTAKRKARSEEDDNTSDQMEDYIAILSTKKKARSSFQIENNNQKIKSDKSTVIMSGDEEESNCIIRRMNSGCYSSEKDSHTSQDYNGGVKSASKDTVAVNLDGKKRASQGSATDTQSIYARKRRERINQRLKILQNLIPNGAKVDISTMLEEAVQYVKFLQLQIKLLSSDDLWMYAPIVYNAMNIGLDLKKLPQ